jgi:hypothetical protein
MRASTEIVGENVRTQQKDPKRKNEKAPLQIGISKQTEQSQPLTKEADVAGRDTGIDGTRRDRKHEHSGHPDGVDRISVVNSHTDSLAGSPAKLVCRHCPEGNPGYRYRQLRYALV